MNEIVSKKSTYSVGHLTGILMLPVIWAGLILFFVAGLPCFLLVATYGALAGKLTFTRASK